MVTEQQVLYLTYLKNTYGHDLKQAMYAGLTQHCHPVANDTTMFGLSPQSVPDFYKQFEEQGGDSDYLQYATQCFLEVRQEILRAQRVGDQHV